MKANKPDQAKEVLGRVIHDHLGRAEYGSANRVLESTDRALRRELVELCRPAFDAQRQSADLAAFLVAGEVWSEAAGIYEKMGVLRPAADAWRRAGDKAATARVMVQAAKAEPDVALALQAAEACLAAEDKAACTQMLELGLRQAMVQQRPILIAEVYRVWKRDIEGAEALITLAESWAGMHDQEALEALVAASSLLPKSTIFANIKELFKRAEALSARLSESLRRFPQIPEGGARYVNYFSATTRFDHTSASLTLVNRSDQLIRRVVVVLELFEKASELYFGENDKATNADALRSSLSRWLWREQATLDAFAMSKPEFVSREVVANLSPGETRTLNLRLNNRVPYRRVRTRFEELDVRR